MTTLHELYPALRDRLMSISGLSVYDHVPGQSEWPGAFLTPPTVDYEGLALDDEDLSLDVILLVSTVEAHNQTQLLEYQASEGPRSIPATIAADRSLGFDDVDVLVVRSRPLGLQELASYGAYGVAFTLAVRLG